MKCTREVLEDAVSKSNSIAGVLRSLGVVQAGGNHAHISRSIKKFGIDTGHFTGQGWARGRTFPPSTPLAERLVVMPAGSPRVKPRVLRRALQSTRRPYVCATCGNKGVWMCEALILHIDHINGNYLDNRAENLRFLCPNCHAQTATYSGRNRRWCSANGLGQLELITLAQPARTHRSSRGSAV